MTSVLMTGEPRRPAESGCRLCCTHSQRGRLEGAECGSGEDVSGGEHNSMLIKVRSPEKLAGRRKSAWISGWLTRAFSAMVRRK